MTLKERIQALCKSAGISMNQLEDKLGFGKGYISKLGKSTPNATKIQAIADFFGVTVDYLITGKETEKRTIELTGRDHRDIKKSVDEIMTSLDKNNGETLYYDGVEVHLSDETKALLRNALTITMQAVKLENKEKYNPHKNGK